MNTLTVNPLLRLPARSEFAKALAKLADKLAKSALAGCVAVFERHFYERAKGGERRSRGSAGRTDALADLADEFDELASGLLAYAATRIDPAVAAQVFRPVPIALGPAGRAARPFGIAVAQALQSQPRLLTSFADQLSGGTFFTRLAASRVLGRMAADVDRFESTMVPEVAELAFSSDGMMDEARAMYEVWFSLVRVVLAGTILRTLPYDDFWRVYGDGGYLLSEVTGRSGTALAASQAYADLLAARADHSWIDDYLPARLAIAEIERDAAAWREHCSTHPCTPSDQGIEHPYPFPPLPPAVHRNPAIAGPADHMHARTTAQARVTLVAGHWTWMAAQVLRLPEGALAFRINAGSLQHGGGHPPHTSHRNGAMFDLGLGRRGAFPVVVCPSPVVITVSEPVIRFERERDSPPPFLSLEAILEAATQTFSLLQEPDDRPGAKPAQVFRFCEGDFEFPGGGLPDVTGAEVPWAAIARRYTQAMLLTFPSQILYARWATLREAQRDLRARATAAQAALPAADDAGAGALAHLLAALPEPPAKRPDSHFGALYPRDDHADHWHLSYRPEDVEAPAAEREQALAWLEANRDRLFTA